MRVEPVVQNLSYNFQNLDPKIVSKVVQTISSISAFGGIAKSSGSAAVWQINGVSVILDWSGEKIRLHFGADCEDLYGRPRLLRVLVQAIGSAYLI